VPSPVASGTRMGDVAAATVLAVLFALLLLWRRRASSRLPEALVQRISSACAMHRVTREEILRCFLWLMAATTGSAKL
jgi:hypothetical protein